MLTWEEHDPHFFLSLSRVYKTSVVEILTVLFPVKPILGTQLLVVKIQDVVGLDVCILE